MDNIICQYCEKEIGKRDKQLIALCKAKKVYMCSIECYNEWEAKDKGE